MCLHTKIWGPLTIFSSVNMAKVCSRLMFLKTCHTYSSDPGPAGPLIHPCFFCCISNCRGGWPLGAGWPGRKGLVLCVALPSRALPDGTPRFQFLQEPTAPGVWSSLLPLTFVPPLRGCSGFLHIASSLNCLTACSFLSVLQHLCHSFPTLNESDQTVRVGSDHTIWQSVLCATHIYQKNFVNGSSATNGSYCTQWSSQSPHPNKLLAYPEEKSALSYLYSRC